MSHARLLQAEALRSKAQRPETARQQQQLARYLYYLGRIQTIQLDYTEAKDSLQQAARKVITAKANILGVHDARFRRL